MTTTDNVALVARYIAAAGTRDGHTITPILERMGVTIRLNCPHAGKTFDLFQDHPKCRIQDEEGLPGSGPYMTDRCVLEDAVRDMGVDILADGDPPAGFPVHVVPVPVQWEVDEGTVWLRPYTPAASS